MFTFTGDGKRYFDLYQDWNGSIKERLQDVETVGELLSRKERLIKEVKNNYYPKGYEKQIISYIRDMWKGVRYEMFGIK